MPEFILDTSGRVPIHGRRATPNPSEFTAWEHLDAFTQGYIEALFFTESSPAYDSAEWFSDECKAAQEEGQADGTIPGDTGFADLAPDSLARIIADCAAFQADNATDLECAYAARSGLVEEYDAEQAGRDFWFTRNGHGVGFWDRGLGDVGDRLSAACGWRTKFGEVHVWFGDHVEHGDAPLVHVQ